MLQLSQDDIKERAVSQNQFVSISTGTILSMAMTDTRAVMLVDIPLVKRLCESGTPLHNEFGFTRSICDSSSTLISHIIFPRELYQFVTRSNSQIVISQFRYLEDDEKAYIVYLAPELNIENDHTTWLHNLDTLAQEAGKHGAHHLVAEVDPNTPLFEVMRTTGFAVYTRQTIWKLEPAEIGSEDNNSKLRIEKELDSDHIGVTALISKTVPNMLHQVIIPRADHAFVYRRKDQIEAYLAVSEGKMGIYLVPYLNPDLLSDAATILKTTINKLDRSDKIPIFICVRGYQNWLEDTIQQLGFEHFTDQAMMVRHIAAGVRQTHFSPVRLNQSTRKNVVPPINN